MLVQLKVKAKFSMIKRHKKSSMYLFHTRLKHPYCLQQHVLVFSDKLEKIAGRSTPPSDFLKHGCNLAFPPDYIFATIVLTKASHASLNIMMQKAVQVFNLFAEGRKVRQTIEPIENVEHAMGALSK